jgi:hypothetical protein
VEEQVASGWASESDIQGYIKIVLAEVIKMAGLANVINFTNELSVFQMRYRDF